MLKIQRVKKYVNSSKIIRFLKSFQCSKFNRIDNSTKTIKTYIVHCIAVHGMKIGFRSTVAKNQLKLLSASRNMVQQCVVFIFIKDLSDISRFPYPDRNGSISANSWLINEAPHFSIVWIQSVCLIFQVIFIFKNEPLPNMAIIYLWNTQPAVFWWTYCS